jgi:hypothetical protein
MEEKVEEPVLVPTNLPKVPEHGRQELLISTLEEWL